ncbi:peptide ABC transporter substrate-binding protein [Fusibacter sp. JL216-2]|uniref:peptide ABC transporter substrate-binding protein n=1 Tax=Fusibacter sp. JL216-2 TaxID=3071453 RepID=UPI003D3254C1
MFKKSLSLLLVLMMVIGSLAGCSSPAEETAPATDDSTEAPAEDTSSEAPAEDTMSDVEQVLYWNVGSEPKTIDPGLNGANDGGNVINNMFEGLMREVDGQIQPGIAESYTVSDDQLVYTFTIRDAKWSDGQAITANDFEYSWNRVLDPETASEYAWIFDEANVDSFKAIDEKTFEVTLKAPTPYFLGLTAFYTFFPVRQEAVEAGADGAWAVDPAKSIVNGPFMLEDYRNGDRLVLVKNPNYWRADQVKLDRIEGLMIVDQATALTGYESGQIHVIDDMPSAEIPRLLAEDPTFMIMPQDGVYYYALNTQVEPMDDAKVRRALMLAIDRTAIVETVTKGGQIPATTMVSQASRDANGNVFAIEAGDYGIPVDGSGVEEAKALLAEAGYPDGEGFPELEIMYNTSEGHKAIAEAIQEMWKQNLNINVTLTNQEWAVFQDTRKQGNFQIARSGWIGDYSDPMTYLGMFVTGSPNNYSRWENSEYDTLLEEAKTQEPQQRFETLYKAHDLVMEGSAYMPIYYYTDPIMVSQAVADWEKTSRNTWFFGFAEIVE